MGGGGGGGGEFSSLSLRLREARVSLGATGATASAGEAADPMAAVAELSVTFALLWSAASAFAEERVTLRGGMSDVRSWGGYNV